MSLSSPIPAPSPITAPLAVRLRQAATDIPAGLAADPPRNHREALHRLETARGALGELAALLLEAERRGQVRRREAESIARQLRDTRLRLRRMRLRLQP